MLPAFSSIPTSWPFSSYFCPSERPRVSRYQRMERCKSFTVMPGKQARRRRVSGCRRVGCFGAFALAAARFFAGARFRFADFLVAIPVSSVWVFLAGFRLPLQGDSDNADQ